MSEHHHRQVQAYSGYRNGVLTACAVLLGILVLQQTTGLAGPSVASAQRSNPSNNSSAPAPREPLGVPNAADQRLRMNTLLETIDGRLRAIEARLNAPLEVRVMEMPEVKDANASASKSAN